MSKNKTPIIITGGAGRMGRMILSQALAGPYEINGILENENSEFIGKDASLLAGMTHPLSVIVQSSFPVVKNKKPVIIDFTSPLATLKYLKQALALGCPFVIGTTGLNEKEKEEVKKASKKIPIVFAPNMSVGVNTLFALVKKAAGILGDGFDIEISEAHHRLKKDAPSGTAVKLAEIAASTTGRKYPNDAVFERLGNVGARTDKEIGMQVIRGGDIVGEHTVYFISEGERIELTHRATSRKIFAAGSLRAASWVYDKKNGLYDMQDVLGLVR